ncbi:MAG TPA: hypothetical protein VF143_07930 [Candidatus Nanopelagicales bacterium]
MLPSTRTQGLSAPDAVVVALWLTAWCHGSAAADDLLGVLGHVAPDSPLLVLDGTSVDTADALLRRGRAAGVVAAWPVLPRPGRTLGWPTDVAGVPEPGVLLVDDGGVARLLLRAGSSGWGLVPTTSPAAAPLLAESVPPRAGARRFAALLEEATADLARLGLDRAPTGAAPARWGRALRALPHSLDPGLVALLHRVALVLDALELALADEGAAVTAGEVRARAARLLALHGQLEDLVTAACVGTATVQTAGHTDVISARAAGPGGGA